MKYAEMVWWEPPAGTLGLAALDVGAVQPRQERERKGHSGT